MITYHSKAGRRASEENTDQGAHHGADTESAVIIPPLFSLSAAAVFSAGDGGVVVVALYPERPRTYFELSPPPAKGQASTVLCSGMRLLGITLAELGPSDSERRLLFWAPLSRIPFVSLGALQRAGKRGDARTPGRGRERLRLQAPSEVSRVATLQDARDVLRPAYLSRRKKKGRKGSEAVAGGSGQVRSDSCTRKPVAGKPQKGRNRTREESAAASGACAITAKCPYPRATSTDAAVTEI